MKWILPVSVILCLGSNSAMAEDIFGQWSRGDGNARVKIDQCGANICATNTWIKPGTPKEKTGDKLIMTISPASDGKYSGTAFDPQRDLTYKISVEVKGNNMTTKGCVLAGLLCKGVQWTRLD
ncbi:DUF2147 domain-containing protein [Agrobacterium sp. AGB01]|uniref:DUF2147 domain-containing protein n=1 Tax=Agrobacterium sp. AGB01 TaxID=2769302 RepID=UPI00178601D0|nr:DUF2147 domain-containing protein [Agrobacterium sp. AGB01]MBD9388367.1 DUF2147 domain-containing protein [Agrobacterium sp. AGB01]